MMWPYLEVLAGAATLVLTAPGPNFPAPPRDPLVCPAAGCPGAPGAPPSGSAESLGHWVAGFFAAVVPLVVVRAKLLAVVGAADQVALAAVVTVIGAPVPKPVTVTLALATGILRGAAPPTIPIPATTSLT